jgi:hypothetical protein
MVTKLSVMIIICVLFGIKCSTASIAVASISSISQLRGVSKLMLSVLSSDIQSAATLLLFVLDPSVQITGLSFQ